MSDSAWEGAVWWLTVAEILPGRSCQVDLGKMGKRLAGGAKDEPVGGSDCTTLRGPSRELADRGRATTQTCLLSSTIEDEGSCARFGYSNAD